MTKSQEFDECEESNLQEQECDIQIQLFSIDFKAVKKEGLEIKCYMFYLWLILPR